MSAPPLSRPVPPPIPRTGRPLRRAAVAVVLALAGAGAMGRFAVWPASARVRAARAFSDLAVCVAGAGAARAAPDDAPVRARRLHPRGAAHPELAACAEPAAGMGGISGLAVLEPALAREAAVAAEALGRGDLPGNLEALWGAARRLPQSPMPDGEPAEDPILDRAIPDLRRAFPGHAELPRDDEDDPPGGVSIGAGPSAVVVRPDALDRPLARASREPVTARARWSAYLEGEHVVLQDPTGAKRDLGPGSAPAVVGDRVVWLVANALHVRRLAALDGGDAQPVPFVPGEDGAKYASCRKGRGRVLAVVTPEAVQVFLLEGDRVQIWGRVEKWRPQWPGHEGVARLVCHEGEARVAWARSEPGGPTRIGPSWTEVPPAEPGRHRVTTVGCNAGGCSHRYAMVSGVDTGWRSVGGWSSPIYFDTPDVLDLGARILLLWQNGAAIRYRLAPLDGLDGAPSPWVAEIARPEDVADLDARAIAWPRWQVDARREVALVLVQEQSREHAAFLLRFDAGGDVRVLPPL